MTDHNQNVNVVKQFTRRTKPITYVLDHKSNIKPKQNITLQTSWSTIVRAAAACAPTALCCFNMYSVFSLVTHIHPGFQNISIIITECLSYSNIVFFCFTQAQFCSHCELGRNGRRNKSKSFLDPLGVSIKWWSSPSYTVGQIRKTLPNGEPLGIIIISEITIIWCYRNLSSSSIVVVVVHHHLFIKMDTLPVSQSMVF